MKIRHTCKSYNQLLELAAKCPHPNAMIAGYQAKRNRQIRISPNEISDSEAQCWIDGYDSFDAWARFRQ